MDKRRPGYTNKPEDVILGHNHHHRIPHIQSKVDTVAYSVRRPALVVRGASKRYGSTLVLQNLNMFAKEGTIYCLVGASNTGKSTILSCITGQKKLTKGELLVYGAVPGSTPSGIPGRRVGFMPQELGLHTELTIDEVLQYHGRLNGLTLAQIKIRTESLASSLDLQHFTTRLDNLSPGLQKRISLACALIHEPELIVLDQPTTGMDILFQKGIWMHLQKLVSNGRTSVILTTQNIEEARQAHRVGVLRNGRLLIEDSPDSLIKKHGTQLLAESVAKLSIKETIRIKNENSNKKEDKKGGAEVICIDEMTTFGIPSGASIEDTPGQGGGLLPSVSYQDWVEQVQTGDEDQIINKIKGRGGNKPSVGGINPKLAKHFKNQNDLPPYPNPSRISNRLRALFIKHFLLTMRHFWFILATLVLPALLILAFCHTIGTPPIQRVLMVGVVNDDLVDFQQGNGTNGTEYKSCTVVPGCTQLQLSCRFLDMMALDLVDYTNFETEEEAIREIDEGRLWGYIHFHEGFSQETYDRINSGSGDNDTDSFKMSLNPIVALHDSNVFIKEVLENTLRSEFERFEKELASDCNSDRNDSVAQQLEETEDPDSKRKIGKYPEFFVPGATFIIAYFIPLFTSGLFYLKEKQQGLISRTMVSGINSAEVLFIHILFQLPILLAQTAILVVIPMFLFGIENKGFWLWNSGLVAIGSFSGMSLSFLLSTLFNEIKYILVTGVGCLLTSLYFSGIIWPVQAQHWILQWISYILPWSLPSESLRSIMIRGWDIMHPQVWQGFVAVSSWTLAYWILIILVLSIRYFRR